MEPNAFFSAFSQAWRTNPPHAADAPLVHDLARIGLIPGRDFDSTQLSADQLQALTAGTRAAVDHIEQYVTTGAAVKPGWSSFQGIVGRYGTSYIPRAVTARVALGANPVEDAVYMGCSADVHGDALHGSKRYVLHFDATDLPPVNAFWSLTAYDKDGYFIANAIDRYAIGDRDPLNFNPDGSLDLQIQKDQPADGQANWLPSGGDHFNVMLRLYWPGQPILDHTWQPPSIQRTS